jgi:hypothetical protein
LVLAFLERNRIHDVAVESMVETFIEVIAYLPVLVPLSNDPSEEVKRPGAKMAARLSYDCVAQRVILGQFQSFNGGFVEISCWKAATNVHDGHLVAILSSNFQAFPCQKDSPLEG